MIVRAGGRQEISFGFAICFLPYWINIPCGLQTGLGSGVDCCSPHQTARVVLMRPKAVGSWAHQAERQLMDQLRLAWEKGSISRDVLMKIRTESGWSSDGQ